MARINELKNNQGLSLLEIIVAITLLSVVLFTVSSLMISSRGSFLNFEKAETSLATTIYGTYEEIINNATASNQITIYSNITTPEVKATSGPKIRIRVNVTDPGDFTEDKIHTYWQDGTQIKYTLQIGSAAASAPVVVAEDVTSLSFTTVAKNTIKINLTAYPTTPGAPQENLETTIIVRESDAPS